MYHRPKLDLPPIARRYRLTNVDNVSSMRLTTLLPIACAALLAACNSSETPAEEGGETLAARECPAPSDEPVWVPAGSFTMGGTVYAEEGQLRETSVDGFWLDRHEVSNAQFARFVEETDYVTLAERPVDPKLFGDVDPATIPPDMLKPGSAMFVPPDHPTNNFNEWWEYVPGANWRKPDGPQGPDADPRLPVVHMAWEDMQAYAKWAGGRLPTEAEWEYAAKQGDDGVNRQPSDDAANSWQGSFPAYDKASDGFAGRAPVGCYAANDLGLHDMVGNVWEVVSDFYKPGHDPADTRNPRGPSENAAYDPINPGFASRVMKGGSYLCAPNYCQRYRPESRQGRDPGLGASNVGFRLAYDRPAPGGA